jgi:hypothetical protein
VPATNISRLEYFIDTDPGFGNANSISVSAAPDVADVFWTMDITGLSNGYHNIFIRSKDNNGNWSLTNKWLFYKDRIPVVNINKVEYFVDSDPGFGNATNVFINPVADTADLNWVVDLSSYNKGFHQVFVRSRDNNGNWSHTNKWLFYKDQIPASSVTRLEYFVDADPGFGNGNTVTIIPANNIANLVFNLNTSSLSEGFHFIFLRSKDNNNNWSLTNKWLFFKEFMPVPLNIKKGEYFFDTDPGFGNGTPIPFVSPNGNNIADFNFTADISALNNAPHYLFVRTLDSNNKWSLTNVITFTKNGVVPVSLINFNANKADKKVLLNWETSSEINSSHFEIERSINGYQFEKIGRVNAAGNSNTLKAYKFIDNFPVKGMNYYRLKEVDLDDQYKYSDIRKVEMQSDAAVFVLNNNLSNGADIIVKCTVIPSFLSIFDITGKKLKDIMIVNNTQHIDLSALPAGCYTAVLSKEGIVIAIDRLVIQH